MKGTIEGLTWETSFTSLSYDCSKCRIGCCRLYEIRLTSNDLKRIADKHASLKKIVDLKDDKTAMKRTKDGCIMLEKNLCRIHDIKPRVCRTFPLFMNPASNGVMKIDCVRLCPEGKEGLKVDEKEVNECVKMLAREYGDYYGMQAKHYRNLTDKLKGRHPLLENLEKIEK
ncbi:MAG: YkgJ family cysteine cluster protein, partial [Candidatus Altiarchaeales archaeon]|nr:YkgJ family cysteine cluster protein [Candidatus Altiarchaeales archaeon]